MQIWAPLASETPSSNLDQLLTNTATQSLRERERTLRPDATLPFSGTIHPQHMSLRSLEEYFRAKKNDYDDPWAA